MTSARIYTALLFSALCAAAFAALPRTSPKKVGLDEATLRKADTAIEAAIGNGVTPGAVLAVVRHGKTAYLKAYGNMQTVPTVIPMRTDAIFDLASCTKPVATATSVMILVENGQIDLEAPVSTYITGFDDAGGTIKVKHLLTHTSGLPPYASATTLAKQYGSPNPEALLTYICNVKRDFAAGSDFQYSCLNFITLQHIVQRVSGLPLNEFASKFIFEPLKMKHTGYLPPEEWTPLVAPTTVYDDGTMLRGTVHDPLARVMNGGVSGNAGLFASAEDLAVFCAMMLNGGAWHRKRILEQSTVELMTTVPAFVSAVGRTYGWDVSSPYASCNGEKLSDATYGHTGFTGTSIVIDPVNDCAVILLANAVHPTDGKSGMGKLRRALSDLVGEAITDK